MRTSTDSLPHRLASKITIIDNGCCPLTRESADMRPGLSDYGQELVAAFDEDLDATT